MVKYQKRELGNTGYVINNSNVFVIMTCFGLYTLLAVKTGTRENTILCILEIMLTFYDDAVLFLL